MSNLEGFRRPPPIGVGHADTMPRHIANLNDEAMRRHNEVEVKENVNDMGFFSKSVFHIKQGPKQIERALVGKLAQQK